jgi:hypothetical protein
MFIVIMQCGNLPIMLAAAHEQHELVNILLPLTKPIPSIPDWNPDGIIRTMKYLRLEPHVCYTFSQS